VTSPPRLEFESVWVVLADVVPVISFSLFSAASSILCCLSRTTLSSDFAGIPVIIAVASAYPDVSVLGVFWPTIASSMEAAGAEVYSLG